MTKKLKLEIYKWLLKSCISVPFEKKNIENKYRIKITFILLNKLLLFFFKTVEFCKISEYDADKRTWEKFFFIKKVHENVIVNSEGKIINKSFTENNNIILKLKIKKRFYFSLKQVIYLI